MRRLFNYFVRGVVVLAPIGITLYLCYLTFVTIDGWLGLSRLGIDIPGLGFVITVAFVTLVGFLASGFITRRALAMLEGAMQQVPVIRLFYNAIRDVLNAFVGEKRRFEEPVAVELAGGRTKVLGFVTQRSLQHLGLPGHVAVYFPQSYNFAGNLIIVPSESVIPLQADSGTVMAFIVSGGLTDVRATEREVPTLPPAPRAP